MSFITYIFSTILLSWVGCVVYLGFRWTRPTSTARRGMLWMVILLSLTIPLTPAFFQQATGAVGQVQGVTTVPTVTVFSPVPVGTDNINEFCHCASPHAGDVIMYQASRVYDGILTHRGWILIALVLATFLVSLRLALRLTALVRVTRRCRNERIEVMGKKVWLVRGVPRLTAGSLRLGGKYIFWHPSLDVLPEAEQQAILLHEYAHICQCNTYEKLFFGFLQSIWILNPIYYFFAQELELLSEYMADEYAASRFGNRKNYAQLLFVVKSSKKFAAVNFFRGSKLKARVAQVLKQPETPKVHLFPAFVLGLILLFPGEFFAENLIREKVKDIRLYELLSKENHQTGKQEFCKKCAYEAVESACN
ncbi:MAG TPA: hypothetical protein ENJ82_03490 [Bacteroidetes bacterium]|nr:hypothetical protein [Bacteroidota bacterium]